MTDAGEMAELSRRLAMSERIIDALVERVERSTEFSASDIDGTNYRDTAFSIFETAVAWEWRVRARTADQRRALYDLAKALADLEQVNAELQREVRERAAAEAALIEAKLLAEQHNADKTRFLAAVSHDLIQPLNAARLFVGALANHRLPGASRTLVEQTSSALDSVEEILEALLEIAQLDAGSIHPSIETIDLDLLLKHLAAEFDPVAREQGLKLMTASGNLTVASDARLLRRILQNLISNALRYTEKGHVEISARRRSDKVIIEVRDTGPGIARKHREIIFQEFCRLEPGRAAGGAGLGLAIVDRAVRMLGHRLTLTSKLGTGSVFRLSVPFANTNGEADPVSVDVARGPIRDCKILAIENEAKSKLAMTSLLEGWGCTVFAAQGENDATAVCSKGFQPDIIIADFHLDDGMTGDVLISKLRSSFHLACPAIIVTADRDRSLHGRLQALGYSVLPKPVNPEYMRATIRSMLNSR